MINLRQNLQRLISYCTFVVFSITSSSGAWAGESDKIFESAYNYIIVDKQGSIISFRRLENGTNVSAIDLNQPTFQVIPYTRFLFAAALFKQHPHKVLSIGLGAGAFNRLFNVAYPAAELTTVEIDPMIESVAETLTGFHPSPLNKVSIEDGRRFLMHSQERWDWIVVDAYVRNSQTPPHLTTVEFFELARRHLTEDGVLVVNIVAPQALFYSQLATLRHVFQNNVILEPQNHSNKVFLGSAHSKPDITSTITRPDTSLQPILVKNGVRIEEIRRSVLQVSLPPETIILTDDYAPTEFLGEDWKRD